MTTVRRGSAIDVSGLVQPAFEASPTAIVIADAGGTILLVNRELERQFGYGRAELLGETIELLVPDALAPIRAARLAKSFDQASGLRPVGTGGDLLGRRKDGSQIVVEIGLQPVQSAEGVFVASILDITERRRSEAADRAALGEQLDFQRFVAELSFRFINVSAEMMPDAIRNGLERICEQLRLDRGSFCGIASAGVPSDPIAWTASGIPPAGAHVADGERFPWALERIRLGDVLAFSTLDEIPSEIDRASHRAMGTKSAVTIPLSVAGRVVGALGVHAVREERSWPPEVLDRLKVIAGVYDQVIARLQRDEAVRAATQEVQRFRDELQAENVYLKREERERLGLTRVIGQSAAVRRVLEQIQQVAPHGRHGPPDSARPAPGRSCSRRTSTSSARGAARADGPGELRGDSGDAHRERAVRTGEGRLHGRAGAAGRAGSSWPTTRRSFSTKSATCRPMCR